MFIVLKDDFDDNKMGFGVGFSVYILPEPI